MSDRTAAGGPGEQGDAAGPIGAAELLRAIGLMADGPVVAGRPVPARGPGVFIVELPAPLATAPVELTRVGKWIERVPTLRLDGEPPTSRALAARLAAFWIPSATVLYVGATSSSIGARIAAMDATPLGDRRPASGGHWLKTLRGLDRARIWWASTAAVEEAEDALLEAFAARVPAAERAALHDRTVVLPFANLRTATGERRASGLSGSLPPIEPTAAPPPTRIVEVPPGAADGASGLPATRAAGGTVRRAPRPSPTAADRAGGGDGRGVARPSSGARSRSGPVAPAGPTGPAGRAVADPRLLSADGDVRLRAELAELIGRRPEVVGRIKAAKELGDLKENADYTAAREEQSFLEGRIAAIEGILRESVVVPAGGPGAAGAGSSGAAAPGSGVEGRPVVGFGSKVTIVEADGAGEPVTYEIVGTAESDVAAGRISTSSPVGRALLGRSVDDVVVVTTPRGGARYRIVDLA